MQNTHIYPRLTLASVVYTADLPILEAKKKIEQQSGLALNMRKLDVFQTAARVFLDYKILQWRCDQMEDSAASTQLKDILWDQAHERNAQFLYDKFTGLEALWIKLGQYLSSRADIMPEPYLKILSKCQGWFLFILLALFI